MILFLIACVVENGEHLVKQDLQPEDTADTGRDVTGDSAGGDTSSALSPDVVFRKEAPLGERDYEVDGQIHDYVVFSVENMTDQTRAWSSLSVSIAGSTESPDDASAVEDLDAASRHQGCGLYQAYTYDGDPIATGTVDWTEIVTFNFQLAVEPGPGDHGYAFVVDCVRDPQLEMLDSGEYYVASFMANAVGIDATVALHDYVDVETEELNGDADMWVSYIR